MIYLLTSGYWRILEFDYECRAVSYLLNLIDEQSWSYNTIPLDETLKILNELLPSVILKHIIDRYSIKCMSSNLSKLLIFYSNISVISIRSYYLVKKLFNLFYYGTPWVVIKICWVRMHNEIVNFSRNTL